jgi:iron only hydrogenase large subunit-like protein
MCQCLPLRRAGLPPERGKVFRAIHDPGKTVVAFVAPAVRSVVSAHFGIPFDQASAFMAGLLKRLGFDRVFDFSFAADLTVIEETTEFLKRITADDTVNPGLPALARTTAGCRSSPFAVQPGFILWNGGILI